MSNDRRRAVLIRYPRQHDSTPLVDAARGAHRRRRGVVVGDAGRFPGIDDEYWVNQVAPLVVIVLLLTALFARGKLSHAILPPVLAAIPIFWMAFGISARIVFFESFRSLWNLPFFAGAGLAGLWMRQYRFRTRPVWLVPLFVVRAAIAGWMFPGTQRAPDPATTPDRRADRRPRRAAPSDHKLIKLTKDAQLHPDDGRVVIRRDKLILNVQPMLSFTDRSPDRCWASLRAARADASPPSASSCPRCTTARAGALSYKDEDASVVDATAAKRWRHPARRALAPGAAPSSRTSTASAELAIQGHKKLSVSFSPVPQRRIESRRRRRAGALRLPRRGRHLPRHAGRAAPARAVHRDRLGPLRAQRPAGPHASTTATRPRSRVTLRRLGGAGVDAALADGGLGHPGQRHRARARRRARDAPPALISFSLAATTIGRGTPDGRPRGRRLPQSHDHQAARPRE